MLSVAVWLCEAINLLDTFPTFSYCLCMLNQVDMMRFRSDAVIVTLSGVVPHRVDNEVLFNAKSKSHINSMAQ